jgi:hypothetical protein
VACCMLGRATLLFITDPSGDRRRFASYRFLRRPNEIVRPDTTIGASLSRSAQIDRIAAVI